MNQDTRLLLFSLKNNVNIKLLMLVPSDMVPFTYQSVINFILNWEHATGMGSVLAKWKYILHCLRAPHAHG
jgi:hypothetical protein